MGLPRTVTGLKCVSCGGEHRPAQAEYLCPSCGGNLQVVYDYATIRRSLTRKSLERCGDYGIWRYLPILPVSGAKVPQPRIGWTPLYKAVKLGDSLGLSNLFIKDDGRNPSASFKDRAGALALARALERKERVIAAASTGNAASSLACLAAGLPVRTVIFVPEAAPAAKIAQHLVFGENLRAVRGTSDQAFDLCVEASREYGWYNRNTGYNPYTREGKKTCAFELCEQLGWRVPDKVFISVGDGNILSGLWKGFRDFRELGLISRLPQLVAVQAEHSDAVKRAFEGDGRIMPVSGKTVADSISVSLPRDGQAAVRALRESGGFAVSVKDEEILAAIPELARGAAVFAEPAASAAYAGLKKAVSQRKVGSGEKVVVLVTGNGLKDVQSAMKSVGQPHVIEPSLPEFRKLAARLKL